MYIKVQIVILEHVYYQLRTGHDAMVDHLLTITTMQHFERCLLYNIADIDIRETTCKYIFWSQT